MINNYSCKSKEENIISKREKENLNKRLRDNTNDNTKMIIPFLIL